MDQSTTGQTPAPITATIEVPTDTKKHPIRGFLWGLVAGIGLALLLVVTKVITLGIAPVVITIVIVALLATSWGIFGPAKKATGPIPVKVTQTPPPVSRFDDFRAAPTSTGTPAPPPAAPIVVDTEPTAPAGADESEQTPPAEPEPRPHDQP